MAAPVPPSLPHGASSRHSRPIAAAIPPAPCAGPSATPTVTITGGLPFQRQQQRQAQALAARAPFTTSAPAAAPPTAGA